MINKPLQFWVDKLKNGEKFSMARWGDGELYCMWGRNGKNSNGCRYSPELRAALLAAMIPKEGFYHGLQRVLPHDEARVKREYPNIEWYDTEVFSIAVAEGKLFPFIEQLRKMPLTVISNKDVFPTVTSVLSGEKQNHINYTIEVQKSNAYEEKEWVIEAIMRRANDGPRVYLFSCGMAANAFIHELHGKVDGWLIDAGHIWDPFYGLMSRCDLEGKTMEDIDKNLKPCND